MNLEEIKKILPHREPMLLIEEVYLEGELAKGIYTVRGDEYFLQGHFPNSPIVPGVIQCEMMAQTCCVLVEAKMTEYGGDYTPFFTGLNNVKFRQPILPNDKIEIECQLTKQKHPFYFAKGTVKVSGKICAQGELSFAIIKNDYK
ncbi:MAG: 3-hydroxyacyl-ACP dehydratase FabZ [Filifactoraceae bacterium]